MTDRSTGGERLALVALLCALALAGVALRRALVLDAPPGPVAPLLPADVRHVEPPPRVGERPLVAAIEADPFRPERRPPPQRFTVAQLRTDALASPERERPAGGEVQLIGTVVMPGGRSFPMAQLAGEPPRIVRIGEHVGGFALRSIEQGRAVFVAAGGARLELQVPKAGS
jgi:hypothetical protein